MTGKVALGTLQDFAANGVNPVSCCSTREAHPDEQNGDHSSHAERTMRWSERRSFCLAQFFLLLYCS